LPIVNHNADAGGASGARGETGGQVDATMQGAV